jgi:hypothetical protein
MFEPTTKDRRSPLDARRSARVAVAMAVALVSVAAVSMTTAAASDSASPDASQATGTTRFDSDWVYTLDLPEGWLPFVADADATGGEDLFEGPDGVSARVGGQASEPGDTVEGRVAANRAEFTADGTCQSDELADRPTTLGGEPAIGWSWRCPDSFHAAINTLGQGMRLRLQVNVPPAAEQQAAAMLEDLRQGFAFADDGNAPVEATAAPTADPARSAFVGTVPPDGTYSAEITSEDLVAKGASPEFAQQNQGTWTWTFADGAYALLQSPNSEGCSGTYESIEGTLVRMATTVETECGYRGDILWAPEPDGIRFQELPTVGASDDLADMTAYFDRVFVRVE